MSEPVVLTSILAHWTRRHRRLRVLEELPLLLSGGLAALGLARLMGPGALIVGMLAVVALIIWRLRRRWSSSSTLAARADRAGRTGDLLQTALSVEQGEAVGGLGQLVLERARQAAPGLEDHAVAPLRLPKAPWMIGAVGLGLLLVPLPRDARYSGTGSEPVAEGLLPTLRAIRRGSAPEAETPPSAPLGSGSIAPTSPDGASGGSGGGGPAAGPPVSSGAGGGSPAGADGTTEAATGMDPLAGSVSLWDPGGNGGPSRGSINPKKRQNDQGGGRVDPNGSLAGAGDTSKAAGGPPGAGPEGEEGEVLPSAGGASAQSSNDPETKPEEGKDESAASGGKESDDEEPPGDSPEAPPENLAGADEGMGRGEDSSGRPGAGGANDAGGSAPSAEGAAAPAWEVALEWVEGRWRDAPATILKEVAEGRTGQRSSLQWQQVHARYRALAESSLPPDEVPPTRRAYLERYFDALAAPEPEPQ